MKLKKWFSLSCALVVALSLTACGGEQDATPGEEQQTSQETKTISILVDANTSMAGIEAVAAAAEEELGIKAEFETQPGGSEGDNLIKTRLSSGTMNDICLYNSGSLFLALNPSEYFLDLSDQEFVSRYDESYKNTVSVGDAVYGVPATSCQGGGWIYNKKVYEELNLEVPETWDELMANCETIKAAGKTAVIGSYKDSWTAQPVFLLDAYDILQGAPTFAEDFTAHTATFANTPSALRAFEKLSETAQYVNEDAMSTTYDMAIDMLANGEGAHYVMLTQALTNINELYPELIDDIGIFAQPGDTPEETGLTVYMPNSFYVSNKSENTEAAIAWLEFYVSEEGAKAYSSAVLPEGPFVVNGLPLPEQSYAAVEQMQVYFDEGKTAAALEFLSPVKGANCPEICVNCAIGNKTALETAEEYDQDCAKAAQQLGLENW